MLSIFLNPMSYVQILNLKKNKNLSLDMDTILQETCLTSQREMNKRYRRSGSGNLLRGNTLTKYCFLYLVVNVLFVGKFCGFMVIYFEIYRRKTEVIVV